MSRYKWVEGSVVELPPGEANLARLGREFTCQPMSFTNVVYRAAAKAGWKATVVTGSTWVVFAFYKPDSYMRPNLPAYPVVKRMRR